MPNYSAKPHGELEGNSPTGDAVSEGESELMEAALHYACNDIPVFPVWNPTEDGGCACAKGLDCPRPAKHPITRRGFKDATTDPDIVRMWWTRHPRANIGMATGSESGLLVIDVDSGKEGFENLAALIHCYGEWPQTPTVRTGGEGMHFYFRYPDNAEIRNDVGKKLGSGIDVRGEGGYVLLPRVCTPRGGSTSGWRTRVDSPALPGWLRSKLEDETRSGNNKGHFDMAGALAGVPEGERDKEIFRLASVLRGKDVARDLAEGVVRYAAANCNPPFPEDEALAKVASAYERYRPGTPSRNYGTDTTDATDTRHQLRELSEAPPFPVEALPEPCRRLVGEAASSIVCPPEFIAVPLLATLGSAIGMSRVVRLKQGWTESAAIYAAIVALSGTKKTPAFKEAAGPAHEKQAAYRRECREAKRAYEEQRADRRGEDEEDAAQEQQPKPTLKRTVVEDTTVEALAVVLEDNPRGVLLARDELSAFVRGMDQYKNHRGSDRQYYLSAWFNSPVSVDRKNLDEPIFLARLFVGVVGSIQPGVLPELIANRQGREGDGFLDRFLFSNPEPMLSRWSDEEISLEAVLAVQWLYDALREDLLLEHNDNGDPRPREVVLSGEALARFRQEVDALREEMEEPDFSNVLRGPWSKLEAYLARLSLVLAMARVVRGPARAERVELEDVEQATSLVEYFKAHARRAYLQLYGESRQDRLLADLTKILKENIGKWKDDPKKGWEDPASKLYDALKARGFDALPPRADELSKEIMALASHVPVLRAERGKRGNERVLRIWLAEPPAPPAPGVRGVRDDRRAEELRLFFEDDHAAGAARLFGDEFATPDF